MNDLDAYKWRATMQDLAELTKRATATSAILEACRVLRAAGKHAEAELLIDNLKQIREAV